VTGPGVPRNCVRNRLKKLGKPRVGGDGGGGGGESPKVTTSCANVSEGRLGCGL
jgi:hypothetical protein